jgi:hypothetical protein
MPRFEIKVKHQPEIKVPAFTSEQMQEIGTFAVQVIKERVAGQKDVFDAPAKPLQPKYAKRKAAKGLQPVRDLRFTGNMLGSVQVDNENVDATHVTVRVKGSTPFRKGIFNQNIDPWFGLSNNDDHRVLDEKVRPIFSRNLKDSL